MAIGRSFQESLQKALRGLETSVYGFDELSAEREDIAHELASPGAQRMWYLGQAFRDGFTFEEILNLTKIDPWFLVQIEEIIKLEGEMKGKSLDTFDADRLRMLKRKGFSDRRIASLTGASETEVRNHRHALNVRPVFKRVDTCAAE